jgi:hypothetical protein
MIVSPATSRGRRGAIAPLAAFLMAFIVGVAAFAVDIGWVVLARTELQAAADAASLAGADSLMSGFVSYQTAGLSGTNASSTQSTIITNAMSNARTQAKNFARYNAAGGQSNLVLNDSDIQFGFTDASNNYTAYNAASPVFPNTIKVTMRLDSTANSPLGLFFGPVLGTKSVNVQAQAAATIMGGTVDSFSSTGLNIATLPMTYDVNAWNNFVATGTWPDGTQSLDGSGVPRLQVYPSVKDTGNFGQLSLNDSNVGTSQEESWVSNGMSPSDLSALQGANLVPLSQHPANTWDWQGSTGFTESLINTVNNYPGKTFLLPLFQPYNSSDSNYQAGVNQGSNYSFDIVQFVGVKIVAGSNRQVLIEPAAFVDPSLVFSGSVVPAGTTSSFMTTFSYPRLSQ